MNKNGIIVLNVVGSQTTHQKFEKLVQDKILV